MNSKWISGWTLMKRWGIDAINLQHYILTTDLIAYSSALEPYTKEDIKTFVVGEQGWHFDLEEWGFGGFYFNIDDVIKIEQSHESQIAMPLPKSKSKKSVDEFVQSLIIYPENDDTINIKVPGRQAEKVPGNFLGFYRIP